MDLVQRFREHIQSSRLFQPGNKLLLAVSGGVDSTVLCELCHKTGYDFIIAHCNFRLRGTDSDRDEQFVRDLANKYQVAFYSKTFDTKTISIEQKKSIEETARDLRYEWFYELLEGKDSIIPTTTRPHYILTGHHADDNIETVVMHFFRGTGIKGLRGILPKQNKVIRPLLFARRQEIEEYAWLHKIEYVSDFTNYEDAFARNFFRNRVMPLVQQFFPNAEKNILHNTARFIEVEQLYYQALDGHKKKLLEKKGNEIHIPVLKLRKSTPLHTIVYEVIKDYGFTSHQTDEVIALLDSESGKYVASQTHRIIRNRAWLIIAPSQADEANHILIEEAMGILETGMGKLKLSRHSNFQSPSRQFSISKTPHLVQLDLKEIRFPLLLRKWKTGDYFYPLGMQKKKKLARFFIDLKLSTTQKENIWVIESDKRILWVVGHRIDDRFKVDDKTKDVLELEVTFQTG